MNSNLSDEFATAEEISCVFVLFFPDESLCDILKLMLKNNYCTLLEKFSAVGDWQHLSRFSRGFSIYSASTRTPTVQLSQASPKGEIA